MLCEKDDLIVKIRQTILQVSDGMQVSTLTQVLYLSTHLGHLYFIWLYATFNLLHFIERLYFLL